MQDAVAPFGKAVMRGGCVELRDLGFQVLVDEQQRLQRAAQVTVATGHDLVDRRFVRSDTHKTSSFPAGLDFPRPIRVLPITVMHRARLHLEGVRPSVRKSADHGYKMADYARMTGLRVNVGKLHTFDAKPRRRGCVVVEWPGKFQ